jgi:hypothetical protein
VFWQLDFVKLKLLDLTKEESGKRFAIKMVQKYQSPVRVYKKPFELVMKAYEMRFPTCDMIPIVKETEILSEENDDANGVSIIDRRAKLAVDAPYILKKIMGVEDLLFRQKNTLDKKNRTLTINAWNESFSTR